MRGHRERLDALVAPIPTPFATHVPASMPVKHSHASSLPMSRCVATDTGAFEEATLVYLSPHGKTVTNRKGTG